MRERPILLNAEMVRAVLDGRKAQTRRVMKVQPDSSGYGLRFITESFNNRETGKYFWSQSDGCGINKPRSKPFLCPFGAVGDRLWVRETWQGPLVDYDDAYSMFKDPTPFQKVENCVYRADGGPCPEFTDADDELRQGWRPSIHMPRWASRITLEITGVRVERLQDISQADAVTEGIKSGRCGNEKNWRDAFYVPGDNQPYFYAATAYGDLWKSIYGEESWQANPWVWVIEYKRVDNTTDKAG